MLSPFGVLTAVLPHLRILVLLPMLCAVGGGVFALITREYSASSRFMPAAESSSLGSLGGMAAQMGLVPSGGSGASPVLYADLLTSGEVLGGVLDHTYVFSAYPVAGDTIRGTLFDLLEIKGATDADRRRAGLRILRDRVGAGTNLKSGIVTVDVKMPWPALAEQVNRRVLTLLQDFDLNRRQAQATAERAFVEGRREQAAAELRAAEQALGGFLDRNKAFESSARLRIEVERLQRRVAERQEVYLTLAKLHEQAKVEEARNTPLLSIVDRPEGSGRGSGSVLFSALLAGVIGGGIAVLYVALRVYLESERDTPEFGAFRAQISALVRRKR